MTRPVVPGLTRSERKVYYAMFAAPGHFLSRAELWALLYTHPFERDSRALEQLIKRLRRKLPVGLSITTAYGKGYGLVQAIAEEGKD